MWVQGKHMGCGLEGTEKNPKPPLLRTGMGFLSVELQTFSIADHFAVSPQVWNALTSIILKLVALILFLLIKCKHIIIERWHLPIAFFRSLPNPSLCFPQIMIFITPFQCSSHYLKNKLQNLRFINICPLECQETSTDLTDPYNHEEDPKYKSLF